MAREITAQPEHEALALYEPHNVHGYPWRPACSCGWAYGIRYAADHAARSMAEYEHVTAALAKAA